MLALSACNKLSDVDKDADSVPQAVATPLGQPYTRDSSGNVTVTARAGAEVVLSGKDSLKSADDTGYPILGFTWKQDATDTARSAGDQPYFKYGFFYDA